MVPLRSVLELSFGGQVSMERVQQRSDIQLRRDKELLRLEEVRSRDRVGRLRRAILF